MSNTLAIASLFGSSFLSATLLPGNSEILLVTLLTAGSAPAAILVLSATVGNTLGGLTNVVIGRLLPELKPQRGMGGGTWLAPTLRSGSSVIKLVTDSRRFDVRVGRLVAYALGFCGFFLIFGKSIALHRVNDDYVARDRLVAIIDVTNLRSHIYAVSVC